MAKTKQTRRMIAMALAAAVTMSSMPVVAFAEGEDTPPSTEAPASYIPPVSDDEPRVEKDPNTTVGVPTTPDNPDTPDVDEGKHEVTVEGPAVGTIIGDDYPTDENDMEYNYEIVTDQGKVTVKVEVENVEKEHVDSDLDYVESETRPDGTNDLYWEDEDSRAPEEFLPGHDQNEGSVEDEESVEGEEPVEGEAPAEDPFRSDDEQYQFEYMGTGNSSYFNPAVVFNEPMSDEEKLFKWGENAYLSTGNKAHSPEDLGKAAKDINGNYVTDEAGFYLDEEGNRILRSEKTTTGPNGETYFLKRINVNSGANKVEGWWADGEWVEDLNGQKYGAVWGTAQQFVLVDKTTGEVITTYCADITNYTELNFGYEMKNLEDEGDGGYYSPEQAAMLRAIAKAGYWGTVGTEEVQATDVETGEPLFETVIDEETGEEVLKLDENNQPIPVMVAKPVAGSLAAMREMLSKAVDASGAPLFGEGELDSLTDGVALTATQMAIWSCSNYMAGAEFINSHYSEDGGVGNVPTDREDEVKLIFRIYEYLKGLEEISIEEKTTADTIINEQNFLDGDLEITILEKVDDHANNLDEDKDNDAYSASVSFALVVQPSKDNGDDLVVSVFVDGQAVAQRRIAGENAEGENYEYLKPDDKGNYTIDGITLIEGATGQRINLSLDGIQNLKDGGVFLFDSEIRNGGKHDSDVSQTMVGMANGHHNVNVSQEIKFSFEVDDERVVVRERHSSGGGNNTPPTPPTPITEIPEEEPPLTNIPEEEPPLSDIPDEEVPLVAGAEDVAEEEGMVLGAEEEAPLVAGEEELIAGTGDSNHMAAGFGGMFAALAGMFMLRRKKEN